eukprot:gene3429-6068_t
MTVKIGHVALQSKTIANAVKITLYGVPSVMRTLKIPPCRWIGVLVPKQQYFHRNSRNYSSSIFRIKEGINYSDNSSSILSGCTRGKLFTKLGSPILSSQRNIIYTKEKMENSSDSLLKPNNSQIEFHCSGCGIPLQSDSSDKPEELALEHRLNSDKNSQTASMSIQPEFLNDDGSAAALLGINLSNDKETEAEVNRPTCQRCHNLRFDVTKAMHVFESNNAKAVKEKRRFN